MSCAVFCTVPSFRKTKWRKVRAIMFIAIGWTGAIPMTHAAQKWGRPQAHAQMSWYLLFLEGLMYITGALIYAVSNK
jgi:adiponectin receptor